MPDDPEPPWLPFFKRAEGLAASAFLTIPYVGPAIADWFLTILVPVCSPPRDRMLRLLGRCFRGSASKSLLRLLPAPKPPAAGNRVGGGR